MGRVVRVQETGGRRKAGIIVVASEFVKTGIGKHLRHKRPFKMSLQESPFLAFLRYQ